MEPIPGDNTINNTRLTATMMSCYHHVALLHPGQEGLPQVSRNWMPWIPLPQQEMQFQSNPQEMPKSLLSVAEELIPVHNNNALLDNPHAAEAAMIYDAAFPLDLCDLAMLTEIPLFQGLPMDFNGWDPAIACDLPVHHAMPFDGIIVRDQLTQDGQSDYTLADGQLLLPPDAAVACAMPSASPATSNSTRHLTLPPTPASAICSAMAGTHPHICPEPSCAASFARRAQLTRHLRNHTKPFKCPVPSCGRGHATMRDMHRHVKTRQSDAAVELGISSSKTPCIVPGCKLAGVPQRRHNLKRHMQTQHPCWSGEKRKGEEWRGRRGQGV